MAVHRKKGLVLAYFKPWEILTDSVEPGTSQQGWGARLWQWGYSILTVREVILMNLWDLVGRQHQIYGSWCVCMYALIISFITMHGMCRSLKKSWREPWCHINPRCACAAKVTVLGLCVCLLPLFWHHRLRSGQRAILMAAQAWILIRRFSETTAFKSCGVKQERKSQYATKYCLTSTGLCHFAHCGSIRSYLNVKSWVKGKRYLQLQLSSGSEKWLTVSAWLWIICMCLHNSRMRV